MEAASPRALLTQSVRFYHHDPVYNHKLWQKYRSPTWRYLPQPLQCLLAVLGLALPVLGITVWSVLCCLYFKFMEPVGWPTLDDLGVQQPFSMITLALSLLLVFKTNSSYGRFWEARTLWGQLVNLSRDLARLALAQFPAGDAELLPAFLRWCMVAPHTIRCHLSSNGDEHLTAALKDLLHPDEAAWLLRRQHRPCAAAAVMSAVVRRSHLDSIQRSMLDRQLGELLAVTGGCERIVRTPIPAAYSRHTSRFLLIYLSLAPLLMWERCGWATVPFTALVSFLLLGTENIGCAIEEPFSMLPLGAMCRVIEDSIKEMAATRNQWSSIFESASQQLPPSQAGLCRHGSGSKEAAAAASDKNCTGAAVELPCASKAEDSEGAGSTRSSTSSSSSSRAPTGVDAAGRSTSDSNTGKSTLTGSGYPDSKPYHVSSTRSPSSSITTISRSGSVVVEPLAVGASAAGPGRQQLPATSGGGTGTPAEPNGLLGEIIASVTQQRRSSGLSANAPESIDALCGIARL